jgi:hypothetical protein
MTNQKNTIYDAVNLALKSISKSIKDNKVYNDISSIIKRIERDELYKCGKGEYNWSLPHKEKMWHITTYFKGKEPEDRYNPAVIEFKQGKPYPVEVCGLIYIPFKIISLFCKTDAAVNNIIPHITFLYRDYPPKMSNDVLNALFANEGVLEKNFKTNFQNKSCVNYVEIYLGDFADNCYIYNYSPNLKLKGELQSFE